MQVCLSTTHLLWNTSLGGHAWVFLNWALGLQAAGARVVLYDKARWTEDPERLCAHLTRFREHLAELGLEVGITLLETPQQSAELAGVRTALEGLSEPLDRVVEESDLFLNFKYSVPQQVVDRFRRSALVDIDPGLLQNWIAAGQVRPAVHDLNFSIGETVGQPGARFPDADMSWVYTPPPVHLPSWPVQAPEPEAAFRTVTNWWGEYELIDGQNVNNEKRHNFLAYVDLPSLTRASLELAIYHEPGNPSEMPMLERRGWRTRPAYEVSATSGDYRRYIQGARGEFSCAKESCMVFANAWISDRSICFLASGKPVVVQHTGPSRFLPEAEGLFRFNSLVEAAGFLDRLEDDSFYREQCQAARCLAEEHFDAERVMGRLLENAMAAGVRRRGRART